MVLASSKQRNTFALKENPWHPKQNPTDIAIEASMGYKGSNAAWDRLTYLKFYCSTRHARYVRTPFPLYLGFYAGS